MHKVIFNGETLFSAHAELLSKVLIRSGKTVEHPCAGKGICRKCLVNINGKNELSCCYKVKSDIVVTACESSDIVSESGADESGELSENNCYVLDIGTTTLVVALVSLDKNNIISVKSAVNPQRIFGADVISRIDYCRNNGVSSLQKPLIDTINSLILSFGVNDKLPLFVTGNTTMLHLFFGVDCSGIGVAPYKPFFLDAQKTTGVKLGLSGVSDINSLPCISAFIGADIVAGLNFVNMPETRKYNILIDFGTNAEIVLFSSEKILCTSAAAGPCFEGVNISCGMSASNGAIYSYLKGMAETIGNTQPKGICGTGLIDIISYLLEIGIIDETGFMECQKYNITDDVYITQEDIRQYQLAKSAVFSALITLVESGKISFTDIDKVYISGGFSEKINIESAVKTGLLPFEFINKCITINNSSLLGGIRYAVEKNNLSVITDNSEYIDLSLNKDFSDLFIKNMML